MCVYVRPILDNIWGIYKKLLAVAKVSCKGQCRRETSFLEFILPLNFFFLMILKYGHIFNLESIDTMQFIILLKKKKDLFKINQ